MRKGNGNGKYFIDGLGLWNWCKKHNKSYVSARKHFLQGCSPEEVKYLLSRYLRTNIYRDDCDLVFDKYHSATSFEEQDKIRYAFYRRYGKRPSYETVWEEIVTGEYRPQREQWRRIPRTKGRYWVSNKGRVRRVYRNYAHLMASYDKPRRNKRGEINRFYLAVTLRLPDKGRHASLNRLVAEAFMPDFDASLCIVHADGDFRNCCIHNLVQITRSDVGSAAGYSRKVAKPVLITSGGRTQRYRSIREAAKAIPCSYQTVMDYASGATRKSVLDGMTIKFL